MRSLTMMDEASGASGTGSFLVSFPDGLGESPADLMHKRADVALASSGDLGERGLIDFASLGKANGVLFDELGVAVIDLDNDQVSALTRSDDDEPLLVEPERYVYALEEVSGGETAISVDYLTGYHDAVDHLLHRARRSSDQLDQLLGMLASAAPGWDESAATWGLQATGAAMSRFTGKDARVAILDTGIDANHPDLGNRVTQAQSFFSGLPPHDGHGHGTHCAGIACGPDHPAVLPRYGVAPDAELFVGKVLDNRGRGADRTILSGLNWAVANRCHVVSMSLGSPIRPAQTYSTVWERAARRALTNNVLVIAAAGNDSRRDLGVVNPVSHPANCPSIVSVGAVDRALSIAYFSNRGINAAGGMIDLVAPGVDIQSSWPMPMQYRAISGTSMAAPHVAGVAALLCEAQGFPAASALVKSLASTARTLQLPFVDAGAGIVQAP
jgi:subtilisin